MVAGLLPVDVPAPAGNGGGGVVVVVTLLVPFAGPLDAPEELGCTDDLSLPMLVIFSGGRAWPSGPGGSMELRPPPDQRVKGGGVRGPTGGLVAMRLVGDTLGPRPVPPVGVCDLILLPPVPVAAPSGGAPTGIRPRPTFLSQGLFGSTLGRGDSVTRAIVLGFELLLAA